MNIGESLPFLFYSNQQHKNQVLDEVNFHQVAIIMVNIYLSIVRRQCRRNIQNQHPFRNGMAAVVRVHREVSIVSEVTMMKIVIRIVVEVSVLEMQEVVLVVIAGNLFLSFEKNNRFFSSWWRTKWIYRWQWIISNGQ